jgi:hydroxyacylglutathione hydrolase
VTHHHLDHDGGLYKFKSAPLYSCRNPKIHDQVAIQVGGFTVVPLSSSYHVEGHFGFYFTAMSGRLLPQDFIFMGDSLFVGGLGAFYSGTTHDAIQYFRKVNMIIGSQTRLYCGHEYSLRNVAFDCYFLNTNWTENCPDAFKFYYRIYDRRKKRLAVVGIEWAEEKRFNPFLLLALGKVKDGTSTFNTILREKRRIYSTYTIEDMYQLNQELESMKSRGQLMEIELIIDTENHPELLTLDDSNEQTLEA